MRGALVALSLCAAACRRPTPAPRLFTSRVAYAPLVEALHAAGQRESDIITVTQASQLTALTPDRRYKFCLTAQGAFRLSPLAADTRPNEFVHPILADGAPVLTAGALSISMQNGVLTSVTLDPESRAYCTDLGSLSAAAAALRQRGVAPEALHTAPRAYDCYAAPGR